MYWSVIIPWLLWCHPSEANMLTYKIYQWLLIDIVIGIYSVWYWEVKFIQLLKLFQKAELVSLCEESNRTIWGMMCIYVVLSLSIEVSDGLCTLLRDPCYIQGSNNVPVVTGPPPQAVRKPTLNWKDVNRWLTFLTSALWSFRLILLRSPRGH